MTGYIGRFAPSPTGPLHAGSLVAALASWLDAKAQAGQWLVRIEDVDTPRCLPGVDRIILQQLADCGLHPDAAPVWQSQRRARYQQALDELVRRDLAYPCTCTRQDIEAALDHLGQAHQRHAERVYPGTCRNGLANQDARADKTGCAWRLRTDAVPIIRWSDRRLGPQQQDVQTEVGDFVLKRADGCFAYQLAVVLDDAAQGVSDVVRGADLADNTARQILLQQCLGLPTPHYLHTPLVRGENGEKLSKQNGAVPIDTSDALAALNNAARVLELPVLSGSVARALETWVGFWQEGLGSGKRRDGVAYPKEIKSFVRRSGRTTSGQAKALADIGPQFLLPYQSCPIDFDAVYADATAAGLNGSKRPVILEIGFGMGEATAHIAALMPEKNFLCCEVHQPGVGALLRRIKEQGLHNIRIVVHDAVEVIDQMLPLQSLDGVHIFFPDPWHKKRHNKRRLIQAALVTKLAACLKIGGYIHCATDWQPYAEQMLDVLSHEPLLINHSLQAHPELAGYAPKPHYRPLTKFENRGINLGHGVWDLVFERV